MRRRIDVPVRTHVHMHNKAMNRLAIPLLVGALELELFHVMVDGEDFEVHLSAHDGWLSIAEGKDGYGEALIWRVR